MIRSLAWIAAGVGASAALAAMGWWSLVSPAQAALVAADEQLGRASETLTRDHNRLDELAALARRSSDLERQAAQLAATAPAWSMDRVVTSVESAIVGDGASLRSVTPGDARDLTDNLTAHPLTMTMEGDYEALRAALGHLQRLEPRLTISNVTLRSSGVGDPLTMDITATAYAASSPPGTPTPKPTAPPAPDRQRNPFDPVVPPTPVPRPRPETLKAVVVIDRVSPAAITLLVRGRTYRAPVGGSVADGVRVLRAVSRRCAELRYGRRTTRACEGESVLLTRRVWPEGRPASRQPAPGGPS